MVLSADDACEVPLPGVRATPARRDPTRRPSGAAAHSGRQVLGHVTHNLAQGTGMGESTRAARGRTREVQSQPTNDRDPCLAR